MNQLTNETIELSFQYYISHPSNSFHFYIQVAWMPEKNAFTLLALMDIVNITTDSCSLTVPERANFVVGIDQIY